MAVGLLQLSVCCEWLSRPLTVLCFGLLLIVLSMFVRYASGAAAEVPIN